MTGSRHGVSFVCLVWVMHQVGKGIFLEVHLFYHSLYISSFEAPLSNCKSSGKRTLSHSNGCQLMWILEFLFSWF